MTDLTFCRTLPGPIVEVEETSIYDQGVGKACALDATTAIGIGFPLFAGATLRARQTLCKGSPDEHWRMCIKTNLNQLDN